MFSFFFFWNAAINIIRKAKDPLGMRQEAFGPVWFVLARFVFGSSCVCMWQRYFIGNFNINLWRDIKEMNIIQIIFLKVVFRTNSQFYDKNRFSFYTI